VLTLFGRRTLYMYGMLIMSLTLFLIGGLGWVGTTKSIWAIGSLLIVLNFVYNCTLGPICYTIIGEVSSTRLRQKSIVLSRIAYQIMNIVCGIIVPRMLSPKAWNWGPKSGIFWGVSAGLSTLYCFLRLPETRGRGYGELDVLFNEKVPAWRFASTKVDRKSPFYLCFRWMSADRLFRIRRCAEGELAGHTDREGGGGTCGILNVTGSSRRFV
jgi:SP family general alpha glucoside:H+ symporter-like MFS transporter